MCKQLPAWMSSCIHITESSYQQNLSVYCSLMNMICPCPDRSLIPSPVSHQSCRMTGQIKSVQVTDRMMWAGRSSGRPGSKVYKKRGMFYSALTRDWRVMIPVSLPLSITGTELMFFFSIRSRVAERSPVRSTEISGELMISLTRRFRIR